MGFKKKVISLILLIAMLSVLFSYSAAGMDMPEILAEAAIFMETNTGAVLFEKNRDVRRAPDSIAKVMTVLAALDAVEEGAASLDDLVTVGDDFMFDIPENAAVLRFHPGEAVPLRDLLYCIFLIGSNEACNIVATHLAGDGEVFVTRMNDRAAALGCRNTHYRNTHGLSDPAQYTTAEDQALILQAAMENGTFAEIAGTLDYTVSATNMSADRRLRVSNSLLREGSRYYYEYALGGKTSATYESGYAYASMAKFEDMPVVAVVLGAQAVTEEDQSTLLRNLSETRRLYTWCFENYAWRTVLAGTDLLARVAVELGDGADYVNLRPAAEIRALLPANETEAALIREVVVYSERDGTPVVAPVKAGDVMGEVTVRYQGEALGTVRLVANTSVALQHIRYLEWSIRAFFGNRLVRLGVLLLAALIAAYTVLVIRYNRRRKARMQKMKERQAQLKNQDR